MQCPNCKTELELKQAQQNKTQSVDKKANQFVDMLGKMYDNMQKNTNQQARKEEDQLYKQM